MPLSIAERIKAPGPKKILSCDGGGILGLMSVEILARLEADLRAEQGIRISCSATISTLSAAPAPAPSWPPAFRPA
jgi:lysophospholipase L1-like esterase